MNLRSPRFHLLAFLGWALLVSLLWCFNGSWASARFLGSDPITILWARDPAVLDPPLRFESFASISHIDIVPLLRLVIPDMAALGLFFAACALLGALLLRPLLGGVSRIERVGLSFAAGSVVVGLALLALALGGAFQPGAVLGIQFGSVALGVVGLAVARWRFGALEAAPTLRLGAPGWVALAGLLVMGLLLLAKAYVVDVDPDSMEFHRVAINQIVRTGKLDICFENYAANRPLQLELFQAVAFDDRPVAQAIQVLFTVMAGLTVAGVLVRRGGLAVAALAMLIYLCDHSVLWRVAVHANENCLGFYSLAGMAALVGYLDTRRWGWLVLGAVLLGFSVGTYYLGLLTATAGAFAVMVGVRQGWKPRLRPLLVFCLVAGAAMSPWLLRNLIQLENPVYPLLFDVFGGRGLNPTSEFLHSAIAERVLFLDRSLASFLGVPLGWPRRELFNGLMLLLWPFAFIWGRSSARLLGLWALGYYGLWFVLLPQDRFLLPVLPVLAALAGLGLVAVLARLGPRLRTGLWAVLLVAISTVVALRCLEHGGLVVDSLARASHPHPQQPPPGRLDNPLIRTVNHELPPDARLAGVSNGFFDKPSYTILPVGFFDLAQMQDVQGLGDALEPYGITHLVIPREGTMEWDAWAGFDEPVVHGFVAALRDFTAQRCDGCLDREMWRVCSLRPTDGASAPQPPGDRR